MSLGAGECPSLFLDPGDPEQALYVVRIELDCLPVGVEGPLWIGEAGDGTEVAVGGGIPAILFDPRLLGGSDGMKQLCRLGGLVCFEQLERFRQALVALRCAGGRRGDGFADRLLDTRQRFCFAGGDQPANECCLLGLLLLEALETLGTDLRRGCDQRLDPLEGDHADQSDDSEPDQFGDKVPGLLERYRRQRKGFDLATAAEGG